MKKSIVTALLSSAMIVHAQTSPPAAVSSPAKKELIQKLMVLQQPGVENMARNLVEQPAVAMMQAAGRALQGVAADKREATGKAVEADIKKYVDEAVPVVRERAIKLAPSTIGVAMEEKFTEDELKQLVAWLESPINKKYAQFGPEIQNSFTQKLVAEARPTIEPKIQALETKVRATLGVTSVDASAPAASAAPRAATPAKKAASK